MEKIDILVTGKFNVLHPGHVRLFKFARNLGSNLCVAVESDRIAGEGSLISESLRLESVMNCTLVTHAFIFDELVTELIYRLRPKAVVKGREHERRYNPEAEALATFGGKLFFSSGEVQFSASNLLQQELLSQRSSLVSLPISFMSRHGVLVDDLRARLNSFKGLRVLTVGDLIIDDYVDCEPLGMSQEDPTLVVSPIDRHRFIGGAGIVAAHAAGLGATSTLITVVGLDKANSFAAEKLREANVEAHLVEDPSRPTTLKERYRSCGKTLLRVSHLHQSAVSIELQEKVVDRVRSLIKKTDLLILSDFNYGVLPQSVVDVLTSLAKDNGVWVAADSQSSSQLGDIGRFKNVDLMVPTEREGRVSTQNREDGLVVLAEQLRKKSNARFILLKLGEDGVLIHAPCETTSNWLTDQVEALNQMPKDVSGPGCRDSPQYSAIAAQGRTPQMQKATRVAWPRSRAGKDRLT